MAMKLAIFKEVIKLDNDKNDDYKKSNNIHNQYKKYINGARRVHNVNSIRGRLMLKTYFSPVRSSFPIRTEPLTPPPRRRPKKKPKKRESES